jgi:hypothetical protein
MIHCCMDNNRKQEIQNQIAELQRELAVIERGFIINFGNVNVTHNEGVALTQSLSDEDIIATLSSFPHIHIWADSDVTVQCALCKYRKVFHVSKVTSYNITPF